MELVNELGYSFGLETDFSDDAIRKLILSGAVKVPACKEFFYLRKWDFQNQVWIEVATEEEIQQQELEQKKILKQQQYEELLPTDWYVVRFVETGISIPEEILQQRQEIRNKYN
jgi:hypothetical protein